MADVALVSIEPASAALSGTKVMARSLDALARANVELLAITSSSYRQSFCFLVRQSELERATEFLEEDLALELAHGYLKPLQVDVQGRPDRGGGRRHARHAGTGRAHLHRHLPPQASTSSPSRRDRAS